MIHYYRVVEVEDNIVRYMSYPLDDEDEIKSYIKMRYNKNYKDKPFYYNNRTIDVVPVE